MSAFYNDIIILTCCRHIGRSRYIVLVFPHQGIIPITRALRSPGFDHKFGCITSIPSDGIISGFKTFIGNTKGCLVISYTGKNRRNHSKICSTFGVLIQQNINVIITGDKIIINIKIKSHFDRCISCVNIPVSAAFYTPNPVPTVIHLFEITQTACFNTMLCAIMPCKYKFIYLIESVFKF